MKGYTLIELIIIFGISSIIVGISVNSFNSYNNTQKFNNAVADVINELNSARSRAISQVKPSQCSSSLEGYEVKITALSRDYEQSALCGGLPVATQQKKLPVQVSFVTGSSPTVPYNVSNGTLNAPRTIAITGYGKTTTISISATGIVSSSSGLSLIGVPAATPTTPPVVATATPTTPPVVATATPTTPPSTVSTAVALSSTPNPSSVSIPVEFTVTVIGTLCTPNGFVFLYEEGIAWPVKYITLSGVNPKSGTASNNFSLQGIHRMRAEYFSIFGCPSASSPTINHRVQ